jgi:hypothetical protein
MLVLDKRDKAFRTAQHNASALGAPSIHDVLALMFHALKHLAACQSVTRNAGRDKIIDAVVLIPGIRDAVIDASRRFLAAPKAHGTVHRDQILPMLFVRLPTSAISHLSLTCTKPGLSSLVATPNLRRILSLAGCE